MSNPGTPTPSLVPTITGNAAVDTAIRYAITSIAAAAAAGVFVWEMVPFGP